MAENGELRDFYGSGAAALRAEIAGLRRRTRGFVVAELVAFVGVAVMVGMWWMADGGWWWAAMAGVMAVVYLIVRSRDVRSSARLEACEARLRVYEGELAYLGGDFSRFDAGNRYVDAQHEFTFDLDVFGRESLFQRIDRTVTTGGSDCLAALLASTRVPTIEEVERRREEIRTLAEDEERRTAFMALRGEEKVDTDVVLRALKAADEGFGSGSASPALRHLALALAVFLLVVFYVLVLAAALGSVSYTVPFAWAMLEVILASLLCARSLRRTSRATNGILRQLRVYERLMKVSGVGDEAALRDLTAIVASIDRRNEFWVLISNALFFADFFIVRRFYRWRARYMAQLPTWIDAVSRFDALVSMATFRFNEPSATDAELVASDRIVFEAEELWHPFLGDRAVRNDFRIEDAHYYIVTGANMAGKSTFLRSVGTNVLLARIGLPVFARRLRTSLFALFSSMRTTDDLQHGISYFNAELLRLEQLLKSVRQADSPPALPVREGAVTFDGCNPSDSLIHSAPSLTGRAGGESLGGESCPATLIILDEILKGTNSLDKLNGSRLFLEAVSRLPVTGLIATHDLELSRMADEHPARFHNFCFEIQLAADITYTYRITPGVARNQNATYLLRRLLELKCNAPYSISL